MRGLWSANGVYALIWHGEADFHSIQCEEIQSLHQQRADFHSIRCEKFQNIHNRGQISIASNVKKSRTFTNRESCLPEHLDICMLSLLQSTNSSKVGHKALVASKVWEKISSVSPTYLLL